MRRMLMWGVIVLALLAVNLAVVSSGAQEKPDATIRFSGGSVSAGIGYSWGSGTLSYHGKKYFFTVDGLSVGAVGATSATASGEVYHLNRLEDFNGSYTAAAAEATFGGGAGATAMRNQAGVVIKLVSTTQGLDLKLATSGVKISLK